MNGNEFETYHQLYADAIARIARKLARRDNVLAEQLRAEGLVALWSLDLSRVRRNPDAYIRQAMKFRMVDELRRLRGPSGVVALDSALEDGYRLRYDDYDDAWVEEPPFKFDMPEAAMVDPWDSEDTYLDVSRELAKLSPFDRDMMCWMYGVEVPGSPGPSPGTGVSFERIALKLSEKYGTPPVKEPTLRYRRNAILARWKKARHLRELWTILEAA